MQLGDGEEELVRLHELLYSGMLAPYRDMERAFVPHLGLGHFLRPGASYDWEHPREEDLDVDTFRVALRRAHPLLADSPQRIDEVHLVGVPDEVLEWSSGERATLPGGARVENVEAFPLGSTTP